MTRARAHAGARAPYLRPDLDEHARGLASTELISLFGANRRCPRAAPRPTWIQHTNKRQRAAPASRTAETHTRRLDIAPRLRYTQSHTESSPPLYAPHIIRRPVYAATQRAIVCARAKMRVRRGLRDAARAAPPPSPPSPSPRRLHAPPLPRAGRSHGEPSLPLQALIATGTGPPRCLTYSTRSHRQLAQRASTQPAHTHTSTNDVTAGKPFRRR